MIDMFTSRAKRHLGELGYVLNICFFLVCVPSVHAQVKHQMFDPLFAISYDPQTVHFELAPASVVNLCRDLRGHRRLWIYAEFSNAGTKYYIVSGFFVYEPDSQGHGDVAPDEDGILVAIRGSRCSTADAAWTMSGEISSDARDKLPETFLEAIPGQGAPRICDRSGTCHYAVRSRQAQAILDGLASNILERYVKAFGGKTAFLEALRHSKATPDVPPVLSRRLEEFRKSN